MKLPQLSLRDLFWLVAVVAMGCGWWVHYQAMNRLLFQAREASRKVIVMELALRSMGFYVDDQGKTLPLTK